MASLTASRSPAPADAAVPADEASQPPSSASLEAGERPPPEADKRDAREGQEEDGGPKTIPMAAFKERLAREKAKVEAIRSEKAATDLRATRAEEAVALLSAELERVRNEHRQGKQWDERDDALAAADLERQARERADRVLREHEERLREQAEQFRQEQEVEQYRASYQRDIDDALSRFPLVDRSLLIHALKSEATKARPATAQQLAEVMHQRQLDAARKILGPSASPETLASTVRSPSNGTPHRFENNAKGMRDFLAASRR